MNDEDEKKIELLKVKKLSEISGLNKQKKGKRKINVNFEDNLFHIYKFSVRCAVKALLFHMYEQSSSSIFYFVFII